MIEIGFIKRLAGYSLAGAFLIGAVAFPAASIDRARALEIDRKDAEVRQEESLLQPGDDTYVDYINHPYPISGAQLFRACLFLDALLIALVSTRGAREPAKQPPKSPRQPSREGLVVVGLTGLAAAVRFKGAGHDLWLDEITTLIRHARQAPAEIVMQASSSNNHLLNSLLSHCSLACFGESALALRLPALLFGIATVPALYGLARLLGSAREAGLAATLLALSYHHVFFSQDARGYSGFLFGCVLATYLLSRALRENRTWLWVGYVASMLVAMLSLLTAAIVVAAHASVALAWLWRHRTRAEGRSHWKAALLAFAAIAYLAFHAYAFVVPDVLGFVFGEYRRSEVGWRFSAELVREILVGLAPGTLGGAALVPVSLVGLLGAVSLCKQNAFFLALLLLPLALTAGVVVALNAGIFPRFFILALPVAILLFARGTLWAVEAIASRAGTSQHPLRAGLFATVLLLGVGVSGWMLSRLHRLPKQDYTGARAFVLDHASATDAIVSVGTAAEGYRYYWPALARTNRVSEVSALLRSGQSVWLLYAFPRDMEKRRPRLLRYIRENFREIREFPGTINGGGIRVCVAP